MRGRRLVFSIILSLCGLLSIGSTVPSSPEQDTIPSFNNDLLYLNVETGNLMIWPAGKATLEILVGSSSDSIVQIAGKVLAFHPSESGSEVALVAQIPFEYGVFWLDVKTLEMVQVASTETIPEAKISPNGKWLAYRDEEAEEIFAVNINDPEEKNLVGTCEVVETDLRIIGCGLFHWSPNSAQLVWSDGRGVWISQPPAYEKKVLNNYVLRRDVEGDYFVGYGISSWSPNSRYLILVTSGGIEGIVFVLLDAQTGKLVEIPGTFQHGDTLPLFVTWLDSMHLAVNSRDGWFERGPGTDIWRIDPSSPELLVHEKSYYFGMPCGIVTDTGFYDDHRVYYVISHVEREYCVEEFDHGLYFSSLPGSVPVLDQELPGHEYWYGGFLWSPDKQFAIMFVEDWSVLSLEEGIVEDLTPFIGESKDVCCFTWVE